MIHLSHCFTLENVQETYCRSGCVSYVHLVSDSVIHGERDEGFEQIILCGKSPYIPFKNNIYRSLIYI